MKYLQFSSPTYQGMPRVGAIIQEIFVVDLGIKRHFVENMQDLISSRRSTQLETQSYLQGLNEEELRSLQTIDRRQATWLLKDVHVIYPFNRAHSLRDFYAFEQHVVTAHANRGREVSKAWYEMPVFYFSNPSSIYSHDQDLPMPKYTQALDYELEVAAIIGNPGRDIPAENALEHIFGFTIFNDWSARDEQRKEMSVGLGPAKGKDFASSFGPYIVTPDELEDRSDGRPGVYDLQMVARVNGEEYSRGNWNTLYYSFGEMIQRASADASLYPGDIIGSGTVGTGCLLELTKGKGPWLQKGDVVELEVERLGTLRNHVV